jgi:predicted nucleic-acid-binding Zn-ribbon protein
LHIYVSCWKCTRKGFLLDEITHAGGRLIKEVLLTFINQNITLLTDKKYTVRRLTMNTLTLKVPDVLNTQLNSYARQKGLSKSEIVRMALSEYFSKDNITFEGSILDLSEDLAGSIEAPSDISINKDYLEGYGT